MAARKNTNVVGYKYGRPARQIGKRGYALIYLGKDHHLSNSQGWAYEHRYVAELILGRKLRKGEEVHHRHKPKTDNSPDNLEIYSSHAEHMVHHRLIEVGRRKPGEANPSITCFCGCGLTLLKFDQRGRPRVFISGHNLKEKS